MPISNDSLIPPSGPMDACSMEIVPLIQMMIQGTQISSGTSFDIIIYRDSPPPSITERGKLWFPPSKGRLYYYKDGRWISPIYPHYLSKVRIFYRGSATELWSEQEGSSNDPLADKPTPYSGAVWEVDHEMDGRTAFGAGAVPGTEPVLTMVEGQTYGSSFIKFTEENFPEHFHFIARGDSLIQTGPGDKPLGPATTLAYIGGGMGNENYILLGHADLTAKPANVGQTSKTGVKPENVKQTQIIPPAMAGFWAKRTERQFYVAV